MSPISRILLLALYLAAGDAHPAQETQTPPARVPVGPPAWPSRPLDELIARLPDVDLERWRDPQGPGFVTHPAVEELRRRMDGGQVLSDEQWLRALTRSGVIRWRSTWPVGEPFAISLRLPRWVNTPRLRVLPRHAALSEASCGLHFAMCGLAHDHEAERAFHRELGRLPLGRHRLVFDVVIEARDPGQWSPPHRVLWQGELFLQVEIVPDLDTVLPPRSDSELRAALRRLVRMDRSSESESDGRLFLGEDLASRRALAGVALPIEVELLHRQQVVETCRSTRPERTWLAMGPPDLPPEHHRLAWLTSLPAPDQDLTGWSLRLRGVEEDALTWWGATTRFDGVVEIPLIELLR